MNQGVFCLCCQGGKRVRNKRSSFFIFFIFTLSSSHDSERWWAEKRRHRYQHYRWLPRLQQYLLFVVDVDVGVCSVWRLRWRPQCWFTLIPPPDMRVSTENSCTEKVEDFGRKIKKKKNYRWKNDQWFHLQWWLRFTFWFHVVSTLNGLTLPGLQMNNFSLSVSKNLSVSDPKSRIFQSFPVIILRVRSSESVVYLSRVYWTQSEGSRCVNDTEPAWGRSVWPVARTRLLSLIT